MVEPVFEIYFCWFSIFFLPIFIWQYEDFSLRQRILSIIFFLVLYYQGTMILTSSFPLWGQE